MARVRQSDRFNHIITQLSTHGSVGVGDLVDAMGVSAATIRRDLALLEGQRLLARTHGGASPTPPPRGSPRVPRSG